MVLFAILSQAPGGPLTPYLQNPHITAGRHRPAQAQPRPRSAGADPVPALARSSRARRLRLLDVELRAGDRRDPRAAAGDARADGQRARFSVVVVGVTFGILSAIKQYSWLDYTITTLAFFGQSMPVFWFALMMQLVFSVYGFTGFGYHIALPSAGISSSDTFDLGDRHRTPDPADDRPLGPLPRALQPLHALVDARGASTPTTCAPPRRKGSIRSPSS